jgi:hypothetical protein
MSGLRIVKVTTFVMAEILKGARNPYTSTLPDDLEVVGVIQTPLDQETQTLDLICRSAEWDQPAEGAAIPTNEPIFTTHHAEMGAPQ